MNKNVRVWEEAIFIPTYGIGEPEKNPLFLEKRVYQGSSGAVYPYPVIEKIEDECKPKQYQAIYLENEYLKIMILPELGGRVQMAYDKIKERHFIYYNQVIKPALVGLAGPWISGGIEFNWPQHHRPSTYLPVDFKIEQLPDGGATVWVNEQERMFHQKGMAGFTLRPGRAVLEIQGKLYNPTPVPQTFLWWANPAVAVNEHYQSVFPSDVHAVFDHGKRDVSKYPIATGTYYKMDYSAGVDISRYKNIPVPTSYMAIQSQYNFVGGYENDSQSGVLHVANHHISPGKKQWTWGNSDFGQAWDRNLTDEDGPYIELMTGVFTDNQPDFSWLQPYEEKTFTQYFLPYRELGVVKNANADLLMNIQAKENKQFVLQLFATSSFKNLRVELKRDHELLLTKTIDLKPEQVFSHDLDLENLENLELKVYKSSGKRLLEWCAEKDEIKAIPDAAIPALEPADIHTNEQLFLTGLHLEQYRHATYLPSDYYLEALRRDPQDIRCNNAMGLLLIRRGQFVQAEKYLKVAVKNLTLRNPNPYDGEALYNLGLCLKFQDKQHEAYNYFYKSTWNAAWQDAGYYSLAQISLRKGELDDALDEINQSLIRNWHNHRARHLKTILLRKLNQQAEAEVLIKDSLSIDPFNFGCLLERYFLSKDEQDLADCTLLMRSEAHNYEELALDYAQAGCWEEASSVIDYAINQGSTSAMLYFYQSWFLRNENKTSQAIDLLHKAEKQAHHTFFPNRLEAILALQSATELAQAPMALYLLGNIWYDKRQYQEARDAWESSAKLNPHFPTVYRNLALAYFNKWDKHEEAQKLLEKAFQLDRTDARILMELDQLYKRLNRPVKERLEHLKKHQSTCFKRDDLYLEYLTLLNQEEQYSQAIQLLNSRQFHPWEGGEGKVINQYQIAHLGLAKQALAQQNFKEALVLIEACFNYPHNLGEGKLHGAQENDFNYYKALALEGLNRHLEAQACLELASSGESEPVAAIFYNDQKPEKIFYQGLALDKLGRNEQAKSRFNKLLSYGEKHLFDAFKMDYFAVSLPDLQIWEDDMSKKNEIHCYYLMALAQLGLKRNEKAKELFCKLLSLDTNHQGAQIHLSLCD